MVKSAKNFYFVNKLLDHWVQIVAMTGNSEGDGIGSRSGLRGNSINNGCLEGFYMFVRQWCRRTTIESLRQSTLSDNSSFVWISMWQFANSMHHNADSIYVVDNDARTST